jgi:hypothetical protein
VLVVVQVLRIKELRSLWVGQVLVEMVLMAAVLNLNLLEQVVLKIQALVLVVSKMTTLAMLHTLKVLMEL